MDMIQAVQSALDAGDLCAALRLCEERLSDTPQDAAAHRHMSLIHAVRGERVAALRAANRACELGPCDARNWSELGRVHAMFNELEPAVACFEHTVRLDPNHADGWHNLGTVLRRFGNREGAFTALKQALLIDPTRAATYLTLGNLLIAAGQLEDAVECFERAAKHDPSMARARSRLAQEMSQRGKVKRAESLFRQSLGLDPGHLEGWLGLGRTLEDLGEAESALECYRNVLCQRPGHALALGHYFGLIKDEADADLLEQSRVTLLAGVKASDRETNRETSEDEKTANTALALIGYGLAKYYDRRKEYQAAAEAGLAANAARRRESGPLDRAALAARVDRLIETYTPDFFAERRRWGIGTDQPVFIVGLPRSGTTLTEQIISAHPLLHGAGELPDLARLAVRALGGQQDAGPAQSAARVRDAMHARELAGAYLRALREGAPKGRRRISDKQPMNYFQLAFAALLFPNARVIHCKRDPRDNALSIWMENFNADQRYATDFEDLAFFTAQYRRLMAHWREALPLLMLEVQYEDTVADVEGQARRLMGFLGVPWDARCLDFHQQERAVQTPSRWQVRQPIYTRSVARWRNYAPYLPDLETAFRDRETPYSVDTLPS